MKKIIAATIFLSSLTVNAEVREEVRNYQLWSNINGGEIIRVIPTGQAVNGQGCVDADSYMVKSTLSPAIISRIYETLLTAKIASRPVTLIVECCQSNRPAIIGVFIK